MKRVQSILKLAALFCLAVMLTHCDRFEPGLTADQDFSVNLASPNEHWPGDVELTPEQQRIMEKFGEPAFERLWFNTAGEVERYLEVRDIFIQKTWHEIDRSWIYLDLNKEIQFVSRTRSIVEPLRDDIKVLCLRGDPQGIELFEQGKDSPIIEWTYYHAGERYKFIDGVQISKEHFQRLPGFRPN